MVEGRTILCFASGYDAPPTSKHHVMHLLAERNIVLWVNYHASRVPTASSSDLLYMARKLGQVAGGLQSPRPNLYVLTPLVLPLPGSAWARRANRMLLVSQIRAALATVRRGPLQVWSFTPDIAYLLDGFTAERVVYYCVDDHASFSGYDREQVLRDEQELCRRADLVVTTSATLQEAKAPWNPNTLLIPHGVDHAHFAKALANGLPAPADLADIPHPRLGFFGLIRDWVDLDLLAEVARRRPEWHFVLIGDADSNVNIARYRPVENMHFLGRKPYERLPAYCKQLDVGLIPFKINELTLAVNPIKLREYLAAGLPVVSTPLPEVRRYERWVHLAEGQDDFEHACEAALSGNTPDARRNRSDAMQTETWQTKVALLEQTLSRRTERRHRHLGRREKPRRKVLVLGAGGGFGFQLDNLLARCPPELDVVLLMYDYLASRYQRKHVDTRFAIRRIPSRHRARLKDSRPVGLRRLPVTAWHCLRAIRRERPDYVVGVGARLGVSLMLAGRLQGVPGVFVGSFTRVKSPSTTARFIAFLNLAKRIYVQWPDLQSRLRRARYVGRVV